jgi:RHS repeat-associated protein
VFTYDVLDRRIGKSVNGTQTWMAYDRGNTFADFNNSGTLTMRYLYGNALDSLFARRDNNGNNAWYLTDMLGSVRRVAQTNGTILDALTYDGYGNILTETNSGNGDRFKFTAREWNSEIGLQFNRARYYDPKAGRWITEDPLRFDAGDPNLYRYVANLPIVATDPRGLDEFWLTNPIRTGYVIWDGALDWLKGREFQVCPVPPIIPKELTALYREKARLQALLKAGRIKLLGEPEVAIDYKAVMDMLQHVIKEIQNFKFPSCPILIMPIPPKVLDELDGPGLFRTGPIA